jgi:hypothetical protein
MCEVYLMCLYDVSWAGSAAVFRWLSFSDRFVITFFILNTIPRSSSYEAWPSLGYKTADHNSGAGAAFSCSLAAVLDVCIGAIQCCCYLLAFSHCDSGLNHLLGCKIHLVTLVTSSLYHVIRPKLAEEHTNAPILLHRLLLICLHSRFTRKEMWYSGNDWDRIRDLLNTGLLHWPLILV